MTDADAWAREFIEHVKRDPLIPLDRGAMIGWFARALLAGAAYAAADRALTRFDPNDRETWPEWGQEVVAWFNARWSAVRFIAGGDLQVWEERSGTGRTSHIAAAGDLWLPLPLS